MTIKLNNKSKLALKKAIATNSNYSFNINEDVWNLDKNVKINLALVLSRVETDLHEGFRNTLAFFAVTYSSSYTKKMHFAFLSFINYTNASHINDNSIKLFRDYYLNEQLDHLSSLRVFLKKWLELEHYGVSENQVNNLCVGEIKGKSYGEMVKTKDPYKGPFTEDELLDFNNKAFILYEKGGLEYDELIMVYLVSFTGRRPIQISHMKIEDVLPPIDDKYYLNIPRAKHNGAFRSELTQLRVSKVLYEMVFVLAEKVKDVFVDKLGKNKCSLIYNDLPLFVDRKLLNNKTKCQSIYSLLKTDYFHIKSRFIDSRLKKVGRKCDFIKNNNSAKINARRFRYTIGTIAAQNGYGEYVIASLLDHRTIKCVDCYVKNIPEYALRINELVDVEISKYSDYFRGNKTSLNSRGKGEDKPKICYEYCNEYKDTKISPPLLCYACQYFRPRSDADHRKIEKIIDDYLKNNDFSKLNNNIASKLLGAKVEINKIIMNKEKFTGGEND